MDKVLEGQSNGLPAAASGHRQMRTVAIAGGPISVIERGAGCPVVLLHGIQGTARTWDAVGPLLAADHRVLAPNLRGRGGSIIPHMAGDYSLGAFGGDLRAVLGWIGQPAVVVAWSMGVSVTLEMMRTYGDCGLRGLVLASGTPCVGSEARWFEGSSAAEVEQEARERGQRLSLVEAAEPHAVAASWQHVQQADFRALLPEIRVPVLVIHGSDDDQCPIAHGRLLAQTIPGARLDEWSGTGHNPMAKDGLRFAAAVREFLASL